MREMGRNLKRVIKRIIEANMNLEHYWFVNNPPPPEEFRGQKRG
jgi:hypothetical protein